MIDTIKSFLKEYIPSTKVYLVLLACIALGTSLFSFPQEAMELTGLTQTQALEHTIRFLVPLLLILIGLLFAHISSVSFYRNLLNINQCIINKKITLSVGEYYEIKTNDKLRIKISLKNISKEKMLPPCLCSPNPEFYEEETDVAILNISPPFLNPGQAVKRINVSPASNEESFAMAQWQDSEEYSSIFFFNIENSNGPRFFRCFVNHINIQKQQIELSIYYQMIEIHNHRLHH